MTNWLKKIDTVLLELDEKPQFRASQPFPIEALQQLLQQLFKQSDLALAMKERGWVSSCEMWDGLGENLLFLTVDMTPLQAPIYFAMSEQDLKELMGTLLSGSATLSSFYGRELVLGFYHYLALEVMQCIEQSGFAKPLSPRLAETNGNLKEQLAANPCFVTDLNCSLNDKTIWGRLLIPKEFRQNWNEHFAASTTSSRIDPHFPVEIGLQVGSSELKVEELKRAQKGDIILLDSCSFDIEKHKGTALVILDQKPIFRGKFKENSFELLEIPFEEAGENMSEEEFDEEDLPEEEALPEEEIEEASSGSGVDVGQLPVNLTVEVSRLKMTLKELSELSPGNLLELSNETNAGVSLLVNGSRVGRGELVQIGETVGVRIITI